MVAAIGSPDAYAGEVPVAYVQTKPGVSVSEQELLDFATTHIPERAAIPKRVRIADQLPLTGVGKIFKPALQQQEIENVIRSEAEAAGVALVDVAVDRDPQAGLMARNPDQRRSKIAGKKSAQKLIGPSNAMRAFAGTGAIFDRLTDRKVPAASPLSCAHQ